MPFAPNHSPAPPSVVACAVLDTQVVLDWLVFRDPRVAPLARVIESGGVRWLASEAMRAEFEHVLDRGVGATWEPDRGAIGATFARLARLVTLDRPPAPALRCADPADQMFIDLALAEGARWLFTRDRALLGLDRRARPRGLTVLRPADWRPGEATPA